MVFRKNGVVVRVVLVAVLTVFACPFMIDATYVVWSPIATDVVTDAMALARAEARG